jgi:hypothetical protein
VDWAIFGPTISGIPMLYPTERREKDVSDYPRAAAEGQALIGCNFLQKRIRFSNEYNTYNNPVTN